MCASGGSAAVEATINSLRSLLSDREHQLSRLEADLAIAKAYSGSSQRVVGESARGESALKIELGVLRQRLSEKEAQVVSGEERLSRLEAVHRVAQVCFLTVPKSCEIIAGNESLRRRCSCVLRLVSFFQLMEPTQSSSLKVCC